MCACTFLIGQHIVLLDTAIKHYNKDLTTVGSSQVRAKFDFFFLLCFLGWTIFCVITVVYLK